MKTKESTQKENCKESGLFAAIPMEQLAGLDETLWLEQMAGVKASKSHKKREHNKKLKKGSRLNI